MSPNHEQTLVMVTGVGKSRMASRYFLHGRTMLGVISKPANSSVGSEHELVWVKYYSVVSTEVKPINGLEKALVKVICPKEGVVNTFSFVTDVRDNLVEPSRVAITRDDVTLGCCFVAVLIPWSYECGEVAIIRMEGDAVVTILAVEDGLFVLLGIEHA